MFSSLARVAGTNTIATVLTGMGKDGAKGLVELRQAGALTMAQDEASCVVYGMPKAAVEQGGTDQIVTLDDMGVALSKAVEKVSKGTRL
jgi:two-component system chemotaxis response regulator CheB